MTRRRRPPTRRKPLREEEPPASESLRVVDPTHVLLTDMRSPGSRVPWIAIGIATLALLWLTTLPRLTAHEMRPEEKGWVADSVADLPGEGSAFSHALVRSAWQSRVPPLEPGERRTVRILFALSGLCATVVFYFLARLMIGPAAALVAAALLSVSVPWIRAGTSAIPLVVGEMLVLLGVACALALQGRHREVGVSGFTAGRVGAAGVLLGLGVLLAPAAVATLFATVLIWLLVGIRRSRRDATTLHRGSAHRTVLYSIAGTVVFLAASAAALWLAERISGGGGVPHLFSNGSALTRGLALWGEVHRRLLSPGPSTDAILLAALGAAVVVRLLEWRRGKTWRAAGLAPWAFLAGWMIALRRDGVDTSQLDVPLAVPPLFVLGLAWLLLRGLQPGRVRRQEYTFLLVWIGTALLLLPFVPGSHPHAPILAAAVTLLPPMLLVAGRAGRALWESESHVLARVGVLAFMALPVAAYAAGAAGGAPAWTQAAGALPVALAACAALGGVAVLRTVRPEGVQPAIPSPRRPRAGGRRRGSGGRPGRGRPRRRRSGRR